MSGEEEPNQTMKYMNRFGCIGDACEENCCLDGWRIDVDKDHYEKLMAMAQFSAKPIARRFSSTFIILPRKTKKDPERYLLKQFEGGGCSLFNKGWCDLHGTFGYEALPHVCAFYPRKLKYVGDIMELSATASCPEVTRQIILPDDAVDLEPIDFSRVHRKVLQDGMDPRDRRPFFRLFVEVRDFVMQLLRDETLSWDQRQFLMLWFSKRTTEVLAKKNTDPDTTLVKREMEILARPEIRHEIVKRYRDLVTPAALVLVIVRGIVRPKNRGIVRPLWNKLTGGVIDSYTRLAEMLPQSDDEAEHDAAAERAVREPVHMTTIEVWAEYQRRRDRLRSVPSVARQADKYFRNYSLHTWFHRMPIEEGDILTYTLRTLTQQSAMKFLLYSQKHLQDFVTRYEEASEADKPAAEAALNDAFEKAAVSVFYQLARHVEHGLLIKWLADMLKKMNMFSAAGGVYLIHF